MTDKVLFLKVADNGTPFSKPSDWNDSANTIICLGGGAGGSAGTSFSGGQPGAGGSSGGIHIATNVTLSSSTQFTVGAGGVGGTGTSTQNGASGTAGGSTFFAGTALGTATVGAQGGQVNGTSSWATGAGGSSFGTAGGTKTNGSAGGFAGGVGWAGAGGGAGAPGTTGAGGAGGSPGGAGTTGGSGGGGANGGSAGTSVASGASTGGAGGNNRSSTGGGTGGAANTNGGAGSNGGGGGGGGATTSNGGAGSQDGIWTATDGTYAGQTAGPGGGGGAAPYSGSSTGGAAGGYGAGGGGSNNAAASKTGGDGSPGLIVIIYTPSSGGTTTRRMGGLRLGLGLGLSGPFYSGGSSSPAPSPTPSPSPGASPDPTVTAATIASAPAKLSLPTTATATVTTALQLKEALRLATGGETIVLAAGTYDLGSSYNLLQGVSYSSTVLVRSADLNNQAIITRTGIDYPTIASENANPTKKLTFHGIKFTNPSTVTSPDYTNLGTIRLCEDIRFSQCTFDCHTATAGDTSYTSGGLKFFGCVRPIVDRCTFNGLHFGLFFQCDGTTRCIDAYRGFNDYTNITEDSARYSGVYGLFAEWEYHGSFWASATLHCDTGQGAVSSATFTGTGAAFGGTRNDGTGTYDQRGWDIRIQHNFMDFSAGTTFVDGSKLWAQGPFFVDAYGSTEQWQRLQIWDNQVWFPGNIGVMVDNGKDIDIQNNIIRRFDAATYKATDGSACHARITVTGCDRVAIVGNTYEEILLTGNSGATNLANTGNTNQKTASNTVDTADRTYTDCSTAKTAWLSARSAAGL